MKDGYSIVARRPRVEGFTDTVSPAKADRIERVEREFRTLRDDDYGY